MIWNIQQILASERRSEGSEILLDNLQRRIEDKWKNISSNEIDRWLNEKHGDWITESFSIND